MRFILVPDARPWTEKGTADGGADSYNPAGMRQLLHQVWKAQCPGDFHFGLRGVCGARCGEKTFREVRIAFGVAAPVPMRCPAVEALVKGLPVDRHTLRLLGDAVGRELFPRDSWRASRELRMQLIRELSQRAVEGAVKQAGGILNESDPHDSQRNTSGAGCP